MIALHFNPLFMKANRIYIHSLDEQTGREEIPVRYVDTAPYVPSQNVINLRAVVSRAPSLQIQRVVQVRKIYAMA